MLLEYGDVKSLKGKPWHVLEVRNEETVENALRRIGDIVAHSFRMAALQIAVPVTERDLNKFELASGPYLYVRSTDFQALLRLKQTTSVVGLLTTGDTGSVRDVIVVDDEFVQGLLQTCELHHKARAFGIAEGSFVRILNGNARGMCGTVVEIHGDRTNVACTLRSKMLHIDTPLLNLICLDHVTPEKRVHFYSPPVEELEETDLIAEYLLPPIPPTFDPPERGVPVTPRSTKLTAVLRKAIEHGISNPLKLAAVALEKIKDGSVAPLPMNLHIVHCIIKQLALPHYPACADYRALKRNFPTHYLSLATLGRMAKAMDCPLPMWTPEEKKAVDGRRNSGRRKSEEPKSKKKKVNKVDWGNKDAVNAYQRMLYRKKNPKVFVPKVDWSNKEAVREYRKKKTAQRKLTKVT